MKNQSSQDTPYNMAVIFYVALNNLIEHKDQAYINNDNFGWYKGLMAIYRKIIFKLTKEEREKVDDQFKTAQDLLSGTMTKHSMLNQCNTFELMKSLDEIDKRLTILMGNKNMIFPKIHAKGLEYLNKKYDLISGEEKGDEKENANN